MNNITKFKSIKIFTKYPVKLKLNMFKLFNLLECLLEVCRGVFRYISERIMNP